MPLLNRSPACPSSVYSSFNRMLMEWIRFLANQLDEAPPEVTTFDSLGLSRACVRLEAHVRFRRVRERP